MPTAHRVRRLLIANRGEIAARVARTARSMGIEVVGIYSDPDAQLPYLSAVDIAVALDGTDASQTYLDIDKIIAAAKTTGADAVHPGYGFLSENADFAGAVRDAGLVYVGPSAESVAAMGSKVRAKELAIGADVPVLPGGTVETDDPAELEAIAERVGFPLLVKASAGGGGRGIRLVESTGALVDAVASARREAAASFGDDTVFLERFLSSPRHIEVQVFGDAHGSVVHFGDRECSVQRRHQKLLEEAPAASISESVRAAMAEAALRLCREIGYLGAGTCEFLVQGDEFYFLEMNTRLQVEHTVTEQVTGVDLVALQIVVGQGEPLPISQADIRVSGHAIQARICAESPETGWLPSSGRIESYLHGEIAAIRHEDGVETGSVVSPKYDSMIAKTIATGASRAEAVAALAQELRSTTLRGPSTNIDALIRILDDPAYRDNDVTVNWLDSREDLAAGPAVDEDDAVVAVAATVISAIGTFEGGPSVPVAWSNTPQPPVAWTVSVADGEDRAVTYRPPRVPGASFPVTIDGVTHAVRQRLSPRDDGQTWRVEVDGILRVLAVDAIGDPTGDSGADVWVRDRSGRTGLRVLPRFADAAHEALAAGPTAPMPGTVLEVRVTAGQSVAKGDALVVVEAMKMEHVVTASADAVVERVGVIPGQAVEAGRVLVELVES
ncbi:ATP-binding protein [Gordonia terrae]